MGRLQDLTGKKFGRLTALEIVSKKPTKWKCLCHCGNETSATTMNLNSGHTTSCGCQKNKNGRNSSSFKHGHDAKSKPYKSWCKIKERCFNPKDSAYHKYGAKGILMAEEFVNDFLAFYAEVGDPPENTRDYSIDRIDNSKGYIKGNMRWASASQQARNRRKVSSNKTGVTGVALREYKESGTLYAIAEWSDGNSRSKSKKFSVKKYGLLPAFAMAVEYREAKIKELNELGYDYSENHGK